MYGTNWCVDCYRARQVLANKGLDYEWVNIDRDKKGERIVLELNNGNRSVPTILLEDGSYLVEPSNEELSEKLG